MREGLQAIRPIQADPGGGEGGGQGGTTPHPHPFGSNEGAGPQQLGSKKVIVKQKSSYKALSLINICCLC